MKRNINRREFLRGLAVLAGALTGSLKLQGRGEAATREEKGIAIVEGENPAQQVRSA